MSVTVQQILGLLQTLAPSELACSWDNVGLLVDVGRTVQYVTFPDEIGHERVDRLIININRRTDLLDFSFAHYHDRIAQG